MKVFEMQGVLHGKAIPGDMKVNESLAEYLVRKLADAEARGVEKAIAHLHCAISPTQDAITIVGVLNDFTKKLREGRA